MSKRMVITQEQAMFSRQKRYLSEKAIIADIDKSRAKQKATEDRAARFLEAHRSGNIAGLTEEDHREIEKVNWSQGFSPTDYKVISDYFFGKAECMEERIKTLGHKLAAFRTEIFSFTTDRAVV